MKILVDKMPDSPYECCLRNAPKEWRWAMPPYCEYRMGNLACKNVRDCPRYMAIDDYLNGKNKSIIQSSEV